MFLRALVVTLFLLGGVYGAEPCPNPHCHCGPVCPCGDACDCGYSYDLAYQEAVSKNKPLVVFVRQVPRPVPGCILCRVERFSGQADPGVILALPDGAGGLDEVARKDSYPTSAWLAERLGALQQERSRQQAQQRAEQQRLAFTPVRYAAPARGCSSGG